MNPEYWGSSCWKFLNCVVLNYPKYPSEYDQIKYKNFFTSLQYVIPCKLCSDNYLRHLYDKPLTKEVLSSRYNLLLWLIDIHNEVNKENNKPILKYEDAINYMYNDYDNFMNNDDSNNNITLYIIIIIILVLLFAFIYYKFK
ncbi:disulfide thiol oxidoreductase, Erv1 / Alr family [Hokovirus HKV1]|uniref:Sulfhydryl oxidase n=1 Tax=Hokovirus HKV1 TaxID=1977638 RepID=A0A1V0SGI5_9VIRU|nr:disulfide thiol oxidoreductase, Erv1 / Alr family [Hokovirus HKV1]